jgi:competence protein ComEC
LFALCLVFIAAAAVIPAALHLYDDSSADYINYYIDSGDEIYITARVKTKDSSKIYLDSIIITECDIHQRQNIPVKDQLTIEYDEIKSVDTLPKIGQTVELSGVFKAYSKATNPGEFDTYTYYRQLNIGGRLQNVEIKSENSNDEKNYSHIKELMFEIRSYCIARLQKVFPEKEAGIMCRILLGDRTGLDSDVENLYKKSGIIHILSISGLHISLVGMGLYKLLRKAGMPLVPAAVTGSVVLILYGLMTGMGVSVCRAIGMYLISMLAVVLRRTYDMLTALGIMAVIMLAQNPLYIYNAGFLLSFASVAGVGIIYPVFSDNLLKIKKKQNTRLCIKEYVGYNLYYLLCDVKESMLAGLSISLMTAPIILWFYYEIPLYSVFINIFVIPLMGVLLISGFVVMFIPYTGILGTVDCLILKEYEIVCNAFSKLPIGSWNPGRPAEISIIIYYLILIVVISYVNHSKKKKEKISVPVYLTSFTVMIMSVLCLGIHSSSDASITFLNVGQGDGMVVRTDEGGVYIFDCGSSNRSSVGEYVLKPYLKYYGLNHINAIVLSHEDADHCNGVEELLENADEWGFTVDNVLLPYVEEEAFDGILDKNIVASGRTKIVYINSGTNWKDGNVIFTCLQPDTGVTGDNTNAASACFLIESVNKCRSILLTGDIEDDGETRLVKTLKNVGVDSVDVLKVAHHGSKYSTSEELINTVHPKLSIISCSRNNRYGHPAPETIDRLEESGSEIMVTYETGAIYIQMGTK